ncbi:cytochrome c biogenesis protein CcsA [Geobacter sp. AOG2]|uniref:cytochrome c biogenesis protein CcsA n=1 Tax=Geobacter sp. AOG2 TaxID=1566347 RepID=UPI001CC5FAD5|nr:cytochrome c biogenesis protein CcsA [Geobacter sp. AOG2]GFE61240.1 cytochrome c biogenesis protein ResC [Geobacter sp. AOG2]
MKWLLVISVVCFLFGSWQRAIFALGIATEVAYLALRGMAVGHLPLIGPHDTIVFFSASLALMSLVTSLSGMMRSARWFPVIAGLLSGLFTLFALIFPPLNMPLPQVLDTRWFELHVVLAFFAYGLFMVGGLLCAGFLVCRQRSWLEVQFKAVLTGWSFFSASMIAGGIWGYYAWGTYWLWTPKELWTSILWLYYALVLHVRLKGPAWDRATAWLGIAGVFVMLFTYLGVSMLMKSSHSF